MIELFEFFKNASIGELIIGVFIAAILIKLLIEMFSE